MWSDLAIWEVIWEVIWWSARVQKTTCQNLIKSVTDNYLQMYKTLKVFASFFYRHYKQIQAYTNILTDTKVNKNAKLIEAWVD